MSRRILEGRTLLLLVARMAPGGARGGEKKDGRGGRLGERGQEAEGGSNRRGRERIGRAEGKTYRSDVRIKSPSRREML